MICPGPARASHGLIPMRVAMRIRAVDEAAHSWFGAWHRVLAPSLSLSAAADSAHVVRQADKEQHQHERDADGRDALVHLAGDSAAAHRLEQREKDVPR